MMQIALKAPSQTKPTFLFLMCVLFVVSVVGCNRGPKIVVAEGTVQFEDGSPVVVGTVETKSLQYEGVQATGKIERDGSFKLTTFVDGDGAAVGEHQCVIVQFVMTEGLTGHQPSTQGVINPKHRNYSTSGLRFTVPDEGTKSIKLVVTGVPKLPGERRHTEHEGSEEDAKEEKK
ncbi:MAG: hypothetical protein MUC43_05425 [Pirellula sp.]|nr:hypothetical protein [Pirellula sp.]